jgi:hypothetical protein
MAISMNVVTKLALVRQWYAELAAIGDCAGLTTERSSDPLGTASSLVDVSASTLRNDRCCGEREKGSVNSICYIGVIPRTDVSLSFPRYE